jgi:hypothetical protein
VDDDVDPREAARIRRRDHDAAAEQRDLMKPGMGKVFKQIQDAQQRSADEIEAERAPAGGSGRRGKSRSQRLKA